MKITQTQIIQETLNKNPSSSTTLSKRKKKKENNHPIFDISKESIDVKSSVKGNLAYCIHIPSDLTDSNNIF